MHGSLDTTHPSGSIPSIHAAQESRANPDRLAATMPAFVDESSDEEGESPKTAAILNKWAGLPLPTPDSLRGESTPDHATLDGTFSAVSEATIGYGSIRYRHAVSKARYRYGSTARKDAFFSIDFLRDLQDLHSFAPLESQVENLSYLKISVNFRHEFR